MCQNNSTPQEIFAGLIHPDRYDKSMLPMTGTGHPTKVTVDLLINRIYAMDTVDMKHGLWLPVRTSMTHLFEWKAMACVWRQEMKVEKREFSCAAMSMHVDVLLRQTWYDPRIQIPGYNQTLALGYGSLKSIWVPDMFFPDGQHEIRHDITTPNVLLRLKKDGRILYSQRLLLTLSCFMELHNFPLDSQECPIKVESYGYTTDDLVFIWDEKPLAFVHKSVPEYRMNGNRTEDCTTDYSTGTYSCLVAWLSVQRDRGFYVTQTFVPSILIVILSWASFWIDKESTPARVSVGLLTVLTITTQSSKNFSNQVKVSYIKAVDVWMSSCLIFVFAAYMEYALVNVLARKYYKTSHKVERVKTIKEIMEMASINGAGEKNTSNKDKEENLDKQANLGTLVDKVSRVLFPCAFVVFNIVFWTFYTLF